MSDTTVYEIKQIQGQRNGLTLKLDVGMPPPPSGGYMRKDMEQILQRLNVPDRNVKYAIARNAATNEHMAQIMRDFNFLSGEEVAKALSILNNLEFFPESHLDKIDPSQFGEFRDKFPFYEGFAPIYFDGSNLILIVSDAQKISAAASRFYDYKTKVAIAAESTIQLVFRKYFSSTEAAFDKILNQYLSIRNGRGEELDNHPGLIRDLLGCLLRHACTLRVSDIHMHMTEFVGLIKLTVDGESQIFRSIPAELYTRLLSKMIMDSRIKQEELRGGMKEGTVEFNEEDTALYHDVFSRYGFRLQLGDAKGGFTAVVRILDRNSNVAELANLQFDEWTYKEMMRIIGTPDGLMLVTGPTGSGKTTSLYAMLKQIDPVSRSIQTIENPVEYRHGLWMQYEISRTAGSNEGDAWGVMLKGLLRNAPKIILMGEVRDAPTAKTLLEAANTGHLVFTTMHTNTAAMAVARLKKLDVDMDSLAGMLLGILAQRLTRVLCSQCKIEDDRPETMAELSRPGRDSFLGAGPYKVYRASSRGCEKCSYTGYTGRKIIYELLINTPKVRKLIETGASTSEIAVKGLKKGHSMWECGLKLVARGITSMDALKKVAKEETLEEEIIDDNDPE